MGAFVKDLALLAFRLRAERAPNPHLTVIWQRPAAKQGRSDLISKVKSKQQTPTFQASFPKKQKKAQAYVSLLLPPLHIAFKWKRCLWTEESHILLRPRASIPSHPPTDIPLCIVKSVSHLGTFSELSHFFAGTSNYNVTTGPNYIIHRWPRNWTYIFTRDFIIYSLLHEEAIQILPWWVAAQNPKLDACLSPVLSLSWLLQSHDSEIPELYLLQHAVWAIPILFYHSSWSEKSYINWRIYGHDCSCCRLKYDISFSGSVWSIHGFIDPYFSREWHKSSGCPWLQECA